MWSPAAQQYLSMRHRISFQTWIRASMSFWTVHCGTCLELDAPKRNVPLVLNLGRGNVKSTLPSMPLSSRNSTLWPHKSGHCPLTAGTQAPLNHHAMTQRLVVPSVDRPHLTPRDRQHHKTFSCAPLVGQKHAHQ